MTTIPSRDLGQFSSRDVNKAAILKAVLTNAPATRAQVIAATGLSKATVSRAVDELRAAGYVEDGATDTAEGRGRRSTYLDVPAHLGYVVGTSMGIHTTRILVTDVAGRELWRESLETPSFLEVGEAADWFTDLIARATRGKPGPTRQIAVAVPAHVRDGREIVGGGQPHAFTFGTDLHERMCDRFRAPVILDSDANLALLDAIANQDLYEDRDFHDVALFNVSTVLTMAACHGGEVVRGHGNAFGHVELLPSGVAGLTLGDTLSVSGLEIVATRMRMDFDRLEELGGHGSQIDPALLDVVRAAVVTAVTVAAVAFDVKTVLFTGRLAPLVDSVLPAVRAALPERLASMVLRTTSRHERNMSTIRGAAYLARQLAQEALLRSVVHSSQ